MNWTAVCFCYKWFLYVSKQLRKYDQQQSRKFWVNGMYLPPSMSSFYSPSSLDASASYKRRPLSCLSSSTSFSTGLSSAQTAASWYPRSKSWSRMSSSAGSRAQLKSWNDAEQARVWSICCYNIKEMTMCLLVGWGLSILFTSLGPALFSGLQSGLIPIPSNPNLLAGKAHTRTCHRIRSKIGVTEIHFESCLEWIRLMKLQGKSLRNFSSK